MSVEIEKKYRLDAASKETVAAALKHAGAGFVGREFEENTIYSNPSLREIGAIVRIRKTDGRSLLTFKRRIEGKLDVKRQVEHETEIADADAMRSILDELGMRPVLVYEKYRDTWRFRSVEIVIDELPFGDYMEIEGSISAIKEAEMLLDLDTLETEHETYPQLTAQRGNNVGGIKEARFRKG